MLLELSTKQVANPAPGEKRGAITFVSLIQTGMSANLYLVWHHDYATAMVCKMLRAEERDDERWRSLLQCEGEILQRVTHPGIVRVFEINMRAALPYLLLEYLPGSTVRQLIRRQNRFALQDALRLTMQLTCLVRHVHNCGYIHRDVKPSNVILHGGYVKLFDFGVAWPLSDEEPPDKSGTPGYLAPEQCRQDVLTPAVDVWALGIFLFELLTGDIPFPEGAYHNYDAALEVRYPQLVTTPQTFKAARRRVPAALQAVVSRCLEFEPSARYQSLDELLIALDPLCTTKIWPAKMVSDKPLVLSNFLQQ